MPKTKLDKNRKSRTPRLLFTGFSMGVADLVPGVSGGTIAFLYGIYDELLFSIKQVSGTFLKLILKGQFKSAWKVLPLAFLVPLLSGIVIAIFSLSKLVTYLLDNHTVLIWSVFFGLVIGSVYVISKRITHWNLSRISLLVLGAVFTFLIIGLSPIEGNAGALAIFLTGMVAFCAMILPGISGSLIMVILGQYKIVINAVSDRDFGLLIFLALGGAVGLALFSRVLIWLLKHYHAATIAFLIGMMIGSLRKVWPWQIEDQTVLPDLNLAILLSVFAMVIGFTLVWYLERLGIAKEHDDIDDPKFTEQIKLTNNK